MIRLGRHTINGTNNLVGSTVRYAVGAGFHGLEKQSPSFAAKRQRGACAWLAQADQKDATSMGGIRGARVKLRLTLMQYDGRMLRYHIAFHLPRASGEMVVAEALDFPGAVTQGFDLSDARLMIASAMEDLAQCLLEEGKSLPTPNPDAAEGGLHTIYPNPATGVFFNDTATTEIYTRLARKICHSSRSHRSIDCYGVSRE
jgi:predicted RNase H-like HicB family nuclease